jgi:hypothetical protein
MEDTITLPDRDREHERLISIVFGVSPAQASVISCLTRSVSANSEQLLAYTNTRSHVKVVVSHARQKLADHGFSIHSKMGVGYWIEAADKRGIEKMLADFVGGK